LNEEDAMTRIAYAQFWVHDQDEALDFYTRVLGWEVRADVTMEAWSFRWLCVGPVGQDDVGLVLMPVPGPPMLDAGDSAQLAQLVAKGAGGTLFLQTDDLQASYDELSQRGVTFNDPRPLKPMASIRRSGIRPGTTSGSLRFSSLIRRGADQRSSTSRIASHSRRPSTAFAR
jgi:catechol 2,3-dioxygenase-like lactoylglutathione lyase family enzyme